MTSQSLPRDFGVACDDDKSCFHRYIACEISLDKFPFPSPNELRQHYKHYENITTKDEAHNVGQGTPPQSAVAAQCIVRFSITMLSIVATNPAI